MSSLSAGLGGTDGFSVRSTSELVVPVSRDWTTLGTGGGIETFLKLLFSHASACRIRVTVLCPGPREETVDSVHFVPIMRHADSELAFTRRLRREFTSSKFKMPRGAIILANTEHYAWAARGLGVPVVLMSHGAIPEMLRLRHSSIFVHLYRRFIEDFAVRTVDKIVVVNAQVKEYYLSHYGPRLAGKFVEIPLGLDLDEFKGRPRHDPFLGLHLPASTEVVLFVGRLYPEKNLNLFITACDLLKQAGRAFDALVVGEGIQDGILKHSMESRSWLHWIPVLSHSEVLDTIAASRALVICSTYETGPLVLLEAIGSGTPIVCSDVGRARELIREQLGRIVPRDPVAYAAALNEILGWSKEDVRRATEQVLARIDFRNTMAALAELLNTLRAAPRVSR